MARTSASSSFLPFSASTPSSSQARSKWSSIAPLPRPVMIRMSSSPARTASSTTYWMAGLSTTGSISLGWALDAGRNRVPSPAAGMTALRIFTLFPPNNRPQERDATQTADRPPPVAAGHRRLAAPRLMATAGYLGCRFLNASAALGRGARLGPPRRRGHQRRPGGHHPVAAPPLGLVHRRVGRAQQLA